MSDSNKLYSLEEVLSISAIMLRKSQKELVALTEGKDLSTMDSLSDVLKELAISDRNELIDSQFKKGFKKAKKDSESQLKQTFEDLDLDGKEEAEILALAKEKLSSTATDTSKTTISTEQALAVPSVAKLIRDLREKATQYDTKVSEFESFKTNQKVLDLAIRELEKEGAKFSENPTIRAKQIKIIENDLKLHKFKLSDNGLPDVLDDEGQHVRFNDTEAKNWDFTSFVKGLSPVDFVTAEPQKKDSNIYVPDSKGTTSNPFGYNEAQLKTIGINEYNEALKSGETAKAEFARAQMYANLEQSKNK
jgi:hypothetical protein